jgi:type VI secretion system protein VasJ
MNLPALGTSPISAENPAGEDVRYQPVFEDLQAEVDKLSSPSAAAASIDWQKISTLAAEILSNQSKDLLVASYFCVAQIHLFRIPGLEIGLQVSIDLLENFWDTLFPQLRRMKGRIAAIDWWIEKCESAVLQILPDTIDETLKKRICAQCVHIDKILEQHLPDSPATLHSIVRVIEEIPSEASLPAPSPADKPEPESITVPDPDTPSPTQQREPSSPVPDHPPPTEETGQEETVTPVLKTSLPEPNAQPAPLSVAGTSPTGPEKDSTESMYDLLRNLQYTASALLGQDLSNPMSYRLLRFSLWSTLEDLPPDTDGITILPPPDLQTTAQLLDLFNSGNWTSMVTAAEYWLPEYIFWMDLNRFSIVALENLGPQYLKAAACLAQETAFFMARLPGLTALKFSDGTPFANKDTQDWLQSISRQGTALPLDQVSMAEGNTSTPGTARISEVSQHAQNLLKDNNLIDAVSLFQQEMRLAFSLREKMLWRLALCRFLIQSPHASLAMPHFDKILEDIQTYRLEEWDPMLALQGLKIMWSGLQKFPDKMAKERAAMVLHQIARIDPVEALRTEK